MLAPLEDGQDCCLPATAASLAGPVLTAALPQSKKVWAESGREMPRGYILLCTMKIRRGSDARQIDRGRIRAWTCGVSCSTAFYYRTRDYLLL